MSVEPFVPMKTDLIKNQEIFLGKYQKMQFLFSHIELWSWISPAIPTIIKYSV